MSSKLKKAGKALLFGAAGSIVLISIVNVAWILSGSNQWELEIDRDGVQVYSFKAPGTFTKQFKGVMRGKYTQSQFVAALLLDNHSLDNCKEWIPACIGLEVLEPYNEKAQGDAVLWTLELLPPLFANREYVIKSHAEQHPETKVVSIDIMAAANKVPLNDCCVRITHIHNRWQIKPVDNGQVEVELVQDFSMGGFFPDFLLNLANAEETYKLFHEKYRTARFAFIDEGATLASAL
jgi:hypothetical protein